MDLLAAFLAKAWHVGGLLWRAAHASHAKWITREVGARSTRVLSGAIEKRGAPHLPLLTTAHHDTTPLKKLLPHRLLCMCCFLLVGLQISRGEDSSGREARIGDLPTAFLRSSGQAAVLLAPIESTVSKVGVFPCFHAWYAVRSSGTLGFLLI
uniref:50S ribosomal protein L11 n=1 Tax=Anthurium amnicola TaxID=1678845 RepID=A0A1D1XNI5_9ARAE